MIEKISNSPLKNKRYRIFLSNGDYFDFGLKGADTFIDGASEKVRENFRKRHGKNPLEENLINKCIPSPAVFSYYLLWGESRDLQTNINWLNTKLK
jgi:hypothetical protein